MAKKEQPKETKKDERAKWFNNDHDLYDWAGRKIDNGAEARRKGTDN